MSEDLMTEVGSDLSHFPTAILLELFFEWVGEKM